MRGVFQATGVVDDEIGPLAFVVEGELGVDPAVCILDATGVTRHRALDLNGGGDPDQRGGVVGRIARRIGADGAPLEKQRDV